MRHDDFDDFIKDYILKGFLLAVIISLLGLFLGSMIFNDHRNDLKNENDFYFHLVMQDEKAEKSNVKKTADLVRSMVMEQGSNSLIEQLQNIENLKESSDFYFKLVLSKTNKIISLVQEGREKTEIDFLIEVPEWKIFLRVWGFISVCFLIFCCVINICGETFNNRESLFSWPWNKWWVYSSVLLLSPALIPAMAIEVVIRTFLFFAGLVGNFFRWLIMCMLRGELRPKEQKFEVEEQKLKDRKRIVLEMIQEIKTKIDITKKRWSEIYFRDIEAKTRELRGQVGDSRSNLSKLGQRISSTQKELAEFQRQLNEWEKTLEQQRNKKKEDCFKDFDQLVNLPHVEAIEVTDEQLKIYTDIIYIDYSPRKRYEIGIFVIKIGLNNGDVRLENLSSTHPTGLFHPYGRSSNFCWGSLLDPITHALSRKEYFVAIQYILQAIQSAEGDNRSVVTEWKEI